MRAIHHGDHGEHGESNEIAPGKLIHAEISRDILDGAIKVHKTLGPGLLESTYEICLFHELTSRGVDVKRQIELPVRYNNIVLECGYCIDLLVADSVIVEVKSVEKFAPIHDAQLFHTSV